VLRLYISVAILSLADGQPRPKTHQLLSMKAIASLDFKSEDPRGAGLFNQRCHPVLGTGSPDGLQKPI
jgi:hypothetical protein